MRSAHLVVPSLALMFALVSMLLITALMLAKSISFANAAPILGLSAVAVALALAIGFLRFRRHLLVPLVKLESSVSQVSQGEPGTNLLSGYTGVLTGMVEDIDSINEELVDLYEDMDNRVARSTTRLAQKTASLKILYDVAASVNQAADLDELLLRFLRILKEMVNGMAATVRLVQPDGRMRVVGSIGLDDDVLTEGEMLPLHLCVCGTALSPGDILCDKQEKHCSKKLGREMFGGDEVELVTVSLDYHDEVLGLYHIFVRKPGISGREDILELLQTIGSHLGVAVAKQRSDIEARRLYIVEERTALAHELHDSLAQTLASLRFQVRMLQDVVKSGDQAAVSSDIERMRNGLDEAHTELRDLLHGFRAPVDQGGLINALAKLVERFKQESGVHSLFQKKCREPDLSSAEEMQMIRIVQECLANIRKHANAHTVRVLLTCGIDGTLVLLVEDDGAGFEQASKIGQPGEHIGLTIMEERAQRLGGHLRIESEPGEGTRVELSYKPAAKQNDAEKRWIV